MRQFLNINSVAVPLMRNNIDTDAIIPSREIKSVSKAGLSDGLFAGWRYTEPGSREPKPTFVLNKPEFADAQILLVGANFGCGSSREQAVWALYEWGIRAIIAPSFGAIFYANCFQNGLLPIVLDRAMVTELAQSCETGSGGQVAVDLEKQSVTAPDGEAHKFQISPTHKEMLLTGQDQIDLTLRMADRIAAFRQEDQKTRPWVYL